MQFSKTGSAKDTAKSVDGRDLPGSTSGEGQQADVPSESVTFQVLHRLGSPGTLRILFLGLMEALISGQY